MRLSSMLPLSLFLIFPPLYSEEAKVAVTDADAPAVIDEIAARHGASDRLTRGVTGAARMWRAGDGSSAEFADFCKEYYLPEGDELRSTFEHIQLAAESIGGHFNAMGRDLNRPLALDIGPILPIDYLVGEFDPSAHLSEDLFTSKIAFAALLNFPPTTLEERLSQGGTWTREQWARARLARHFTERIPAPVQQAISKALTAADNYIAGYNIYMHNLLTPDGKRLFPEGLRLITHWNLRDEIKAQYADKDGLPRQRMIQTVMEKIITQQIPENVIDNPKVDWTPTAPPPTPREPDRRYARLLDVFHAARLADPYSPDLPTHIDRCFKRDREIPEEKVASLFKEVLTSPAIAQTAKLIEKRLGRKLEPFDIWYNGFKARGRYTEAELDKIVSARYPTAAAFQAGLPDIFRKLGFAPDTTGFLASKIVVDPSRGPGHALGAQMRDDNAHLRTRVGPGGMDYKGYNIAVHELGHCTEQVFSLNHIDYTILAGVPSTGFTEAMAYLFQNRDLELLGLSPDRDENLETLDKLWMTYEIAGVSLVDMAVWHWMYDHPNATAAELREAVIQISKDTWNAYYAPVFGTRDVILLGIYSHMIDAALYLPDYPLGHFIEFQIRQYMEGKDMASEMERMCKLGSITPDAWMQAAVGAPISAEPMLRAAAEALKSVK
ncbi:MAG: hypothetical protein AB1714_27110 [Acidobacteriota bacterium]